MFNIFNNGDTLLAYLAENKTGNLKEKTQAQIDCADIFKAATLSGIYEVPVLPDVHGLTPLHYALGISTPLSNAEHRFVPLTKKD